MRPVRRASARGIFYAVVAVLLWSWIFSLVASAQQAILIEIAEGRHVGVYLAADGTVHPISTATILKVTPPTPVPVSDGQIICLRPWSCTLDESDADLTIRESIDAVKSDVSYISVLPGTLNEQMVLHPSIEAYRKLVPDASKAWVFHVTPTSGNPILAHQGPLDADEILGWIDVPRVNYARGPPADEDKWLDFDFQKADPERCGALPPTRAMLAEQLTLTNVTSLPGFRPIPKSEWDEWTARFPVSRLAKSIRHVTDQVMGSCVGHSCGNGVEGAEYMQAGDRFFRKISMMSMYTRIGRSPNSGAYVGDAADEIFESGILPATGEVDLGGNPYPHTHQVSGGFYDDLPTGWEATGKLWKAAVYRVDSTEAAFRVLMDCRLRSHIGRRGHALSVFGVTASKRWAYENSWGNWGDFGCVGYDGDFNSGYVYHPVLRDEVKILVSKN